MRELVESKNYCELYNCYAVWITDNRQFFTTGHAMVRMPDNEVKKPFGFRSFLKTFMDDPSHIHTVEQDASEYLSSILMVYQECRHFRKQFPNIIKHRQRN